MCGLRSGSCVSLLPLRAQGRGAGCCWRRRRRRRAPDVTDMANGIVGRGCRIQRLGMSGTAVAFEVVVDPRAGIVELAIRRGDERLQIGKAIAGLGALM